MHGTFNGLHLNRITALSTSSNPGASHTTFRVLGEQIRALEERLRLNVPVLLILSDRIIEGTLVHYTADLHGKSYEITIESKD